MYELQGNNKYNMILGRDILYKLKIGLFFSINTIRGNIVTSKGCMTPMKDTLKLTSTCHPIGLTMKYFGMKNYGRDNMCYIPQDSRVAY